MVKSDSKQKKKKNKKELIKKISINKKNKRSHLPEVRVRFKTDSKIKKLIFKKTEKC